MTETDNRLRRRVADMASAYVSSQKVTERDLILIITQIAAGLTSIAAADAPAEPLEPVAAAKMSAYRVARSVQTHALISFEDGQPYKTLRKHLTARGITPEAYRAKWGLPDNYPMVAEAYHEVRSRLAKQLKLGRKPGPLKRSPA